MTDALRALILVLFGVCVGETAWIVWQYFQILKATRRLLPRHVVAIGVATLGLQLEAVWQNAVRFGDDWTWYIPLNLALFTLTLFALADIRNHISRKRDVAKEITSLSQDRNDMP